MRGWRGEGTREREEWDLAMVGWRRGQRREIHVFAGIITKNDEEQRI